MSYGEVITREEIRKIACKGLCKAFAAAAVGGFLVWHALGAMANNSFGLGVGLGAIGAVCLLAAAHGTEKVLPEVRQYRKMKKSKQMKVRVTP
jgi:hypothetical protein